MFSFVFIAESDSGGDFTVRKTYNSPIFHIYRVIPVNVTNLFFLITSKVVKIEPSYWVEKKQNFMRMFRISMILKSDHWSLHNALISKSGQNADKSGIWLFSNYFWDLLSENVHIVTK